MSDHSNEAVRVTAWAAILGGFCAYLNVAFMVAVTGGDMAVTLRGTVMLTLSADMRQLFRLSMLADLFGFYLPLLAIGGYLWHRFRAEAGALGDMAALAILLYVALGMIGASLQLAVLTPLARLHAAGGEAARVAAETAWTTIATGSQLGLWWCEGPLMLFWGLVVGGHLKRAGWSVSIRWPLALVGWCFGLYFVTGFFPALETLTYAALVVAVGVFPLWMLMFGLRLRRHGPQQVAA